MFYRVPGSDGKTKSSLDVNLVYSKFLFVTLKEHARARTRLQDAGSCIARGFFNISTPTAARIRRRRTKRSSS